MTDEDMNSQPKQTSKPESKPVSDGEEDYFDKKETAKPDPKPKPIWKPEESIKISIDKNNLETSASNLEISKDTTTTN